MVNHLAEWVLYNKAYYCPIDGVCSNNIFKPKYPNPNSNSSDLS